MYRTGMTLFLAVMLLSPLFSQQQGANMSFNEETFNFGQVLEKNGPITHVFNFINTGNEPLVIKDVQASCGCTTPDWTREPIKPGSKGYIKATFNPSGRQGPFEKSVTVLSNSYKTQVELKLRGEIIPREPTVLEKYSFKIGDLRLVTSYLSFGKIAPGKPQTKTIEVFNPGPKNLTLAFPVTPAHIKAVSRPATIKANQKAVVEFTYDATKKNDWGYVNDAVPFTLNGKADASYKFNITGIIEEDYSTLTPEQLASAPRIALEKNTFECGNLKSGATVEVVFNFKNVGKSELRIRKINPTCGCTSVKARSGTIKPGETSAITALFNTTGQYGSVNKAITVITNDPKNVNLILWIRGNVQQ